GHDSTRLELSLAVSGDLVPRLTPGGEQVHFVSNDGQPRLGYRDLRAWDAEGRALASRMVLVDGRVRLVVDDRDARYPVTVDPIAYSISTLQPRSEERRAGKRRPPYWRGSCLRKLDA